MLGILLLVVFTMVYDVKKLREFFLQEIIFSMGGIGPKIWDLGIFSDFCTFFRVAKNLIHINNAFNENHTLSQTNFPLP